MKDTTMTETEKRYLSGKCDSMDRSYSMEMDDLQHDSGLVKPDRDWSCSSPSSFQKPTPIDGLILRFNFLYTCMYILKNIKNSRLMYIMFHSCLLYFLKASSIPSFQSRAAP
jgi:hypothetical protein